MANLETQNFDYIVVGAGTAGCVMAHRLSEDGQANVLLIEGGPSDRHWMLQMPAGLRSVCKPSNRFNYWYKTVPQKNLNGREIDQPRGRALGGSSSINAMVFLRGLPSDYDNWEHHYGCDGWSFSDCLPYFKKLERFNGVSNQFRNSDGVVGIKRQHILSPLNAAFLQAGQQAGHPLVDDVNGVSMEGVSRFDMNVENGFRCSSSRSYLHNQPKNTNLKILTRAHATNLIFKKGKVKAVCVNVGGKQRQFNADSEVILSAGVYGSPQLLMLSGVGPEKHLRSLGIKPIIDHPFVGGNFHDHLEAHLQMKTDLSHSLNRYLQPHMMIWTGIQWFCLKKGAASVNQCHVGAFLGTDDKVKQPNVQFHFFPAYFDENWMPDTKTGGYRLGVGSARPESRGTVKLQSTNPNDPLLIDPNYLDTEQDRYEMREGIRLGRELMSQPALAEFNRAAVLPGSIANNDAALDEYIREHANSSYHPCGTVKMGADYDETAVLDTQLRLRGIDGLRVVDASIIPAIPTSNINACVFMIAEKIADSITKGH